MSNSLTFTTAVFIDHGLFYTVGIDLIQSFYCGTFSSKITDMNVTFSQNTEYEIVYHVGQGFAS